VQQSSSPSPINQAFHSIRWAHNIASRSSPTDSYLVKNILEGAKRRLSVPIKKKKPITPDLLSKMYDNMFCIKKLYTQRTLNACLLAYSRFLRVSELLNIQSCDILFYQNHMSVFIQKRKIDIYRDGDTIVIARTGNTLCPVQNIEIYLEWSCNPSDSDVYLFRNLTKSKDHFIFRKDNKPLSYTRMKELFIEAISSFVPNIKSFGLHSLREGGATAACNFGISDRLLKRHGRWKSKTDKDGYVKDSFSDRILVSLNLGL
jgi:integrase